MSRGAKRDLLVFGGAALFAVGASLAYLPAGPMAFGGFLTLIGIFGVPQLNHEE